MKKVFVLVALVAFLGVLAAPVTAAYSTVTVEMAKELKADDDKKTKTAKKADEKKATKSDCSSECKSKCDGDKKSKKSDKKK